MNVKAEVYTQVLFLGITCPECRTYSTLDVDDDKVMTPEGEVLCDVSEIDDIYVTKEFECTHCGEMLSLTGGNS